jgi:hypothetical protein
MSFNLRKRNIIGPRFGELMGKHCHAALTAAARHDRAEYDKCIAAIENMMDTIENETDWGGKPKGKPVPKPIVITEEPTPEPTPTPVKKKAAPTKKRTPKDRQKKVAKDNDN